MGITNPSPGELIDRLAILQIKLQKARARKLPYSHFSEEQDQIWGRLSTLVGRLGPETLALAMRLSQVHIKLWDTVDKQRDYVRSQIGAAQILDELQELNAERVNLRESIDKLLGMYSGAEKM